MGTDWGEYYGTEDPNKMSEMIDGYREPSPLSIEDEENKFNNAVKELEEIKTLFHDDKEIQYLADELIKWEWPYLFIGEPNGIPKKVWDDAIANKNKKIIYNHLHRQNSLIIKEL